MFSDHQVGLETYGVVVEMVAPAISVVVVEIVGGAKPFLKFVVAKVMGLLFTRVDRHRRVVDCGIAVTAIN